MTPRNAAVAGITLAAALAIGGLVFDSNPPAMADVRSSIDPNDIILFGARVDFLSDGGCGFTVDAAHQPQPGDVQVVVPHNRYDFNGARCQAIQLAAGKAALLDYKRDGGAP